MTRITTIQCPKCQSERIRKNGMNKGKQNHVCVDCGRQFITERNRHRGYSDEIVQKCLSMYANGMGFRAIERSEGVHHTSIINWVKQANQRSTADDYNPEPVFKVGEFDELEMLVMSK
jgi:transposase-like protein